MCFRSNVPKATTMPENQVQEELAITVWETKVL